MQITFQQQDKQPSLNNSSKNYNNNQQSMSTQAQQLTSQRQLSLLPNQIASSPPSLPQSQLGDSGIQSQPEEQKRESPEIGFRANSKEMEVPKNNNQAHFQKFLQKQDTTNIERQNTLLSVHPQQYYQAKTQTSNKMKNHEQNPSSFHTQWQQNLKPVLVKESSTNTNPIMTVNSSSNPYQGHSHYDTSNSNRNKQEVVNKVAMVPTNDELAPSANNEPKMQIIISPSVAGQKTQIDQRKSVASSIRREMFFKSSAPGDVSPKTDSQRLPGDYRHKFSLGKGGFGEVHCAEHIPTHENVAVKILDKKKLEKRDDFERLRREIKISKMLKHPNVIELYEIIEDEFACYLVMEHCQKNLYKCISNNNNKLSIKAICRYFQQIIYGLEYIHKMGIAHRDMKPQNILIDHDDNIKIIDFGLSNFYQRGSMLQSKCGSQQFAAPELFDGEFTDYDPVAVDIWAVGVILFQMLTGYLPFDGRKESLIQKKIKLIQYSIHAIQNKPAKDLIEKMLVKSDLRIGFEGIKKSEFFNLEPHTPPNEGIFRSQDIEINEKVLDILYDKYYREKNEVRDQILHNQYNRDTCIYRLVLKKQGRAEEIKIMSKRQDKNSKLKEKQPPLKVGSQMQQSVQNLAVPQINTFHVQKDDENAANLISGPQLQVSLKSLQPRDIDNNKNQLSFYDMGQNRENALIPLDKIDFLRNQFDDSYNRINLIPQLQHNYTIIEPKTTKYNPSQNMDLVDENQDHDMTMNKTISNPCQESSNHSFFHSKNTYYPRGSIRGENPYINNIQPEYLQIQDTKNERLRSSGQNFDPRLPLHRDDTLHSDAISLHTPTNYYSLLPNKNTIEPSPMHGERIQQSRISQDRYIPAPYGKQHTETEPIKFNMADFKFQNFDQQSQMDMSQNQSEMEEKKRPHNERRYSNNDIIGGSSPLKNRKSSNLNHIHHQALTPQTSYIQYEQPSQGYGARNELKPSSPTRIVSQQNLNDFIGSMGSGSEVQYLTNIKITTQNHSSSQNLTMQQNLQRSFTRNELDASPEQVPRGNLQSSQIVTQDGMNNAQRPNGQSHLFAPSENIPTQSSIPLIINQGGNTPQNLASPLLTSFQSSAQAYQLNQPPQPSLSQLQIVPIASPGINQSGLRTSGGNYVVNKEQFEEFINWKQQQQFMQNNVPSPSSSPQKMQQAPFESSARLSHNLNQQYLNNNMDRSAHNVQVIGTGRHHQNSAQNYGTARLSASPRYRQHHPEITSLRENPLNEYSQDDHLFQPSLIDNSLSTEQYGHIGSQYMPSTRRTLPENRKAQGVIDYLDAEVITKQGNTLNITTQRNYTSGQPMTVRGSIQQPQTQRVQEISRDMSPMLKPQIINQQSQIFQNNQLNQQTLHSYQTQQFPISQGIKQINDIPIYSQQHSLQVGVQKPQNQDQSYYQNASWYPKMYKTRIKTNINQLLDLQLFKKPHSKLKSQGQSPLMRHQQFAQNISPQNIQAVQNQGSYIQNPQVIVSTQPSYQSIKSQQNQVQQKQMHPLTRAFLEDPSFNVLRRVVGESGVSRMVVAIENRSKGGSKGGGHAKKKRSISPIGTTINSSINQHSSIKGPTVGNHSINLKFKKQSLTTKTSPIRTTIVPNELNQSHLKVQSRQNATRQGSQALPVRSATPLHESQATRQHEIRPAAKKSLSIDQQNYQGRRNRKLINRTINHTPNNRSLSNQAQHQRQNPNIQQQQYHYQVQNIEQEQFTNSLVNNQNHMANMIQNNLPQNYPQMQQSLKTIQQLHPNHQAQYHHQVGPYLNQHPQMRAPQSMHTFQLHEAQLSQRRPHTLMRGAQSAMQMANLISQREQILHQQSVASVQRQLNQSQMQTILQPSNQENHTARDNRNQLQANHSQMTQSRVTETSNQLDQGCENVNTIDGRGQEVVQKQEDHQKMINISVQKLQEQNDVSPSNSERQTVTPQIFINEKVHQEDKKIKDLQIQNPPSMQQNLSVLTILQNPIQQQQTGKYSDFQSPYFKSPTEQINSSGSSIYHSQNTGKSNQFSRLGSFNQHDSQYKNEYNHQPLMQNYQHSNLQFGPTVGAGGKAKLSFGVALETHLNQPQFMKQGSDQINMQKRQTDPLQEQFGNNLNVPNPHSLTQRQSHVRSNTGGNNNAIHSDSSTNKVSDKNLTPSIVTFNNHNQLNETVTSQFHKQQSQLYGSSSGVNQSSANQASQSNPVQSQSHRGNKPEHSHQSMEDSFSPKNINNLLQGTSANISHQYSISTGQQNQSFSVQPPNIVSNPSASATAGGATKSDILLFSGSKNSKRSGEAEDFESKCQDFFELEEEKKKILRRDALTMIEGDMRKGGKANGSGQNGQGGQHQGYLEVMQQKHRRMTLQVDEFKPKQIAQRDKRPTDNSQEQKTHSGSSKRANDSISPKPKPVGQSIYQFQKEQQKLQNQNLNSSRTQMKSSQVSQPLSSNRDLESVNQNSSKNGLSNRSKTPELGQLVMINYASQMNLSQEASGEKNWLHPNRQLTPSSSLHANNSLNSSFSRQKSKMWIENKRPAKIVVSSNIKKQASPQKSPTNQLPTQIKINNVPISLNQKATPSHSQFYRMKQQSIQAQGGVQTLKQQDQQVMKRVLEEAKSIKDAKRRKLP